MRRPVCRYSLNLVEGQLYRIDACCLTKTPPISESRNIQSPDIDRAWKSAVNRLGQ